MKAAALHGISFLIAFIAPAVLFLGVIEDSVISGLVGCLGMLLIAAYTFHVAERTLIVEATGNRTYRGTSL